MFLGLPDVWLAICRLKGQADLVGIALRSMEDELEVARLPVIDPMDVEGLVAFRNAEVQWNQLVTLLWVGGKHKECVQVPIVTTGPLD